MKLNFVHSELRFPDESKLMIFRIDVPLYNFVPDRDTWIGQKIILCAKISRKFQIQFLRAKPRFQRNRTWQFFGYTRGWIIFPLNEGRSIGQEIVLKMSRYYGIKFARIKLCSWGSQARRFVTYGHLVEIPSMCDRLVRRVIQNVC